MIFPSAEKSTLEKSEITLALRLAECDIPSLRSHPLSPIGKAIKLHGLFEPSATWKDATRSPTRGSNTRKESSSCASTPTCSRISSAGMSTSG